MSDPKKVFTDGITVVEGDFLNTIFGGDVDAATNTPEYAGHFHDVKPNTVGTEFGHAPQIDLTSHVTGRLTLPTPELKSIKLSSMQATPLISSLFWAIPIPSDAYISTTAPMYLNIYWSGTGTNNPGNAAFRIDWEYIALGQNVMPPSILLRGASAWPSNINVLNNPASSIFRFQANVNTCVLNVNSPAHNGYLIPLTMPTLGTLVQYHLLGLEITTAPTIPLLSPMAQINIFAVELLYYSQTLGVSNSSPNLLSNDGGLSDF
jgi:hypothetical protein